MSPLFNPDAPERLQMPAKGMSFWWLVTLPQVYDFIVWKTFRPLILNRLQKQPALIA
jgi:hypothetical protein